MKVEDAVEKALDTPILDIGDIRNAEGALIHIEGGDDMIMEGINRAGEIVIERISPNARVSWGARVNSAMQGSMRATVVLSWVESPFLVEGLKPFAALSREPEGEAEEVEVIEQPSEKRGFFGKLFG